MVRKLDPENRKAVYTCAKYSFDKMLWQDAVRALNRYTRLDPLNGIVYQMRGRALANLGKWDGAIKVNESQSKE
jgi:predicted Zn-dependent protease